MSLSLCKDISQQLDKGMFTYTKTKPLLVGKYSEANISCQSASLWVALHAWTVRVWWILVEIYVQHIFELYSHHSNKLGWHFKDTQIHVCRAEGYWQKSIHNMIQCSLTCWGIHFIVFVTVIVIWVVLVQTFIMQSAMYASVCNFQMYISYSLFDFLYTLYLIKKQFF